MRFLLFPLLAVTLAAAPGIVFQGGSGPGKGKHIVLIAADDEYRSEEALPQLAKILSKYHGFKCTVLFAIDPATGFIKPDQLDNIPGLEVLKTADLVIPFLRWRDLPDDQTKYIIDYAESGKPMMAMRTATHPFNFKTSQTYAKWNWNNKDPEWEGGFGRLVFGETWYKHHGKHKFQSTRGVIAKGQEKNPIVRGIKDGDIWGPTDVYAVRLPLPGDSQPVVMGQVLSGMNPTDPPAEGKQNDPMMPIAWVRHYKNGRVFATTMGAATDLPSEGVRRMLVNACYWAVGLEGKIPAKSKVDLVGDYKPSAFGFGEYKKGVKPEDLLK